jgi:hypothetical protein
MIYYGLPDGLKDVDSVMKTWFGMEKYDRNYCCNLIL